MRRPFFILLFCVILTGGFAQEARDWYMGKPIRNIVFEGLNNVRNSDLAGVIEPYINKPFTDDVYWELFGRLFALEYFETINTSVLRADAEGNEVIIRFTVTERPVASRIVFTGNNGVRPRELNDAISTKVSDLVTQEKLRYDEIAIINLYLGKGYPDVKVSVETTPSGTGALTVTYNIDEGARITIEAFVFEGNTVFTSRRLQSQLSLKVKGIINDGAFREANFIADQQTLIQYYRDRGYIDAAIVDTSRELRTDDKGNNNLTITFRIYEGRLYTFGGISFIGNQLFTDDQLSALVFSKQGDTVNDRRLQADMMRVMDLYLENGYIFNGFNPLVDRDPENGVLSINMVITERERAHIENIIVRGNERTKDEVILREIPLESGDVFSKAKIMDGLRNLYNLQIFSQIIPDTPAGSADALMDLVITVEEQPTTDIQLGLTFSGTADPDQFPVSGMFKWADRNFLGTGNVVGADLSVSPDAQSLSLSYMHRWMFGSPLSGSFDLSISHAGRRAATNNMRPWFEGKPNTVGEFPDGFGSYEDYERAGFISPDEYMMPYDQWLFSIGVGTGYRWPTALGNLTLSGGLRIGMLLNVYDADVYRPFDSALRNNNNQLVPATSMWVSVALDQRDIFYDPSRGYYGIQRFGYYGFLDIENEHFIRSDTKAEIFFTLFDFALSDNWSFKAVLGFHTGLSFILPQFTGVPELLPQNRLAIDGMFNGRGWNNEYGVIGNALWENWMEIRLPLVPGILSWDFFFDAAGVKATNDAGDFFTNFSGNDMRYSLGYGIRFTIPQFPLRFSFAHCFKFVDGNWVWEDNGMGRFVLSFALSSY